MSSIANKIKNYWYVKNTEGKKYTDKQLKDYWFIRGAYYLDMTEEELNKIYRLSKSYVRLKVKDINVCMTEKEQKKLENELERIDEKIIELTEAHNAIKGNKKILIGTYSLFPLRIYELSEYTKKTGKRYSRKKYWDIDSWLFCHTAEVISFYD